MVLYGVPISMLVKIVNPWSISANQVPQVPRPLHGSHPARRHTKALTSILVAKSEVKQEMCVVPLT